MDKRAVNRALAVCASALLLLAAAAIAPISAASQPAQMSVRDCLLQTGYSSGVPDTPVTTLVGADACGGGFGELALRDGQRVGTVYLDDSDGARRMISFHVYAGAVFVFVYKHPDDAARRLPHEPAETWHGDCFLRVGG